MKFRKSITSSDDYMLVIATLTLELILNYRTKMKWDTLTFAFMETVFFMGHPKNIIFK